MQWYKHFIGDYMRDTTGLSLVEHGAYRLLLDRYYATARPLPADPVRLARMIGAHTDEEHAAIATVLSEFWQETEDGWINQRAASELDRAAQRSAVNQRIAQDRETKRGTNRSTKRARTVERTVARNDHLRARDQNPESDSRDQKGTPPIPPPAPDDVLQAVEAWNTLAERLDLPRVQRIPDARRARMKARLAECGGLDGWRVALERIAASPFLRGENERGWRANLDFVLQASSFTKIMEGTYDGTDPARAADPARNRRATSAAAAFRGALDC